MCGGCLSCAWVCGYVRRVWRCSDVCEYVRVCISVCGMCMVCVGGHWNVDVNILCVVCVVHGKCSDCVVCVGMCGVSGYVWSGCGMCE